MPLHFLVTRQTWSLLFPTNPVYTDLVIIYDQDIHSVIPIDAMSESKSADIVVCYKHSVMPGSLAIS